MELLLLILKATVLGVIYGLIMTIIISLVTGEFKTNNEIKNLFIGLSIANALIVFLDGIYDLF